MYPHFLPAFCAHNRPVLSMQPPNLTFPQVMKVDQLVKDLVSHSLNVVTKLAKLHLRYINWRILVKSVAGNRTITFLLSGINPTITQH